MATKFIYTDTELQEIIVKYNDNVSLEILAQEYNKSVASVRMKLVKQGVYKKTTTTAKASATGSKTQALAKFQIATTKSGILAQLTEAMNRVGPALL